MNLRERSWEYYSKKKDKNTYKVIKDVSPLDFYRKYVPYNIQDMVCLINVPDKSCPFYKKYDIKYLGNVVDGQNTNYMNVPMDVMVEILKSQLIMINPFGLAAMLVNIVRKNRHFGQRIIEI